MNLLKLLFRRKINRIQKSTSALPIFGTNADALNVPPSTPESRAAYRERYWAMVDAVPLRVLRKQIEAEGGWAYSSLPTRNHLWQKFKLWAWQRRQIKKAKRPLPHMQQVSAGHWIEQPLRPGRDTPWLADAGDPTIPSITTDLHYWKTHEPVIVKLDEGVEDSVDLVSGKRLIDVCRDERLARQQQQNQSNENTKLQ